MKEIKEAASYLQLKGISAPLAGIILGTGLGGMVKEIEIITEISYSEIPHFPVSTVESHSGKLIYGTLHGKKVLAMQGRFHYYEGYSLAQVTFPVRVMHHLGIKYLLISNAAGTVNEKFRKGSLMLLNDHINLLPDNPLRGKKFKRARSSFSRYESTLLIRIEQKIRKNSCPKQYYAAPRGVCRGKWTKLRNTCRISLYAAYWSRCSGHEYCTRMHCSQPHGPALLCHFRAYR